MKNQSDIEFEEWAKPRGYDMRRWFDKYLDIRTEAASQGWSARDAKIIELSEKQWRINS